MVRSELLLGKPFSHQSVAIESLDTIHIRVWFHDVDLGTVEIEPAVDDVTYEAIERAKTTTGGPSKAAKTTPT
jgi:hypothetical protein